MGDNSKDATQPMATSKGRATSNIKSQHRACIVSQFDFTTSWSSTPQWLPVIQILYLGWGEKSISVNINNFSRWKCLKRYWKQIQPMNKEWCSIEKVDFLHAFNTQHFSYCRVHDNDIANFMVKIYHRPLIKILWTHLTHRHLKTKFKVHSMD